MNTAVFLIGFLCLGLPGAEKCHNIASKYLYITMEDCVIAKNNIEYELKDLDGLALQCISSDLVENYTNYRPNVVDPNTQ